MRNSILFLTLKVFSATGGIEKVCRIAGKALYEQSLQQQQRVMIYSMHDPKTAATNNPYFPAEMFRGYGARKAVFIEEAVMAGIKSKVVILSHINLLMAAWIIKKRSPKTKIILLAHGIEIWDKISTMKKMMLGCCDEIVSVSAFTSDRVQKVHGIAASKCSVLNNCYLPLPKNVKVSDELYQKYHCNTDDIILFTLTRLSSTEHYKGYDVVLRAMQQLPDPRIKYLLAGKYDAVEKAHLDKLIKELGLEGRVLLPGFIPDEEVGALFSMATLYVMPSSKEGFGIVFIEAMYYGLPVIAGNADGSVDALLNGQLGTLVTPQSVDEVKTALENIIANRKAFVPDRELLEKNFGYDGYKERLGKIKG